GLGFDFSQTIGRTVPFFSEKNLYMSLNCSFPQNMHIELADTRYTSFKNRNISKVSSSAFPLSKFLNPFDSLLTALYGISVSVKFTLLSGIFFINSRQSPCLKSIIFFHLLQRLNRSFIILKL